MLREDRAFRFYQRHSIHVDFYFWFPYLYPNRKVFEAISDLVQRKFEYFIEMILENLSSQNGLVLNGSNR